MSEIGATLREARMRLHIDISEIEAQTKIRAKYLRALENEEWDLLPAPVHVTAFLRTYARALGLDSKALLEEYRKGHERSSEIETQPISPAGRRARQQEPPSRNRARILLVLAVLIVIAIVLTFVFNGKPSKKPKQSSLTSHRSTTSSVSGFSTSTRTTTTKTSTHTTSSAPLSPVITLQVVPTAAVVVCLVARDKHHLIDGIQMHPGSPSRTFRSRHFYLQLSNSSAQLRLDGTIRTVPQSSKPIGYSITKKGRHRVPVSKLPSCE
jgi:cytoskeletal protein RodZ